MTALNNHTDVTCSITVTDEDGLDDSASVTVPVMETMESPQVLGSTNILAVEDVPIQLGSLLNLGVIDDDEEDVTVTVSVAMGTVASGESAAVLEGASNTATFVGNYESASAFLANMWFVTAPNDTNSVALHVAVQDDDGLQASPFVVAISVMPVNDMPLFILSASDTVDATENTSLPINSGVVIMDVEASSVSMTLCVNDGVLTVQSTSNVAVDTGSVADCVVITGATGDVAAAANSIEFSPRVFFHDIAVLSYTLVDGEHVATATRDVDVASVPTAPFVDVSAFQVVADEDSDAPLGDLFSRVEDDDDSLLSLTITRSPCDVLSGTLMLIIDGTPRMLSEVGSVLQGGLSHEQMLSVLQSLVFVPDEHSFGVCPVLVFVGDSDTAGTSLELNVRISAVNDAPQVTALSVVILADEDDEQDLGFINVDITDVDAVGFLQVEANVSNGRLNVDPAVVGVTGRDEASLVIEGDIPSLIQALASLFYVGDLHYFGDDTLTLTVIDDDNASVQLSRMIFVNPVEDVPEIFSSMGTTPEDTPVGINVSVFEAENEVLTVTVDGAVNGNVFLDLSGPAPSVLQTNTPSTVVLEGDYASINNVLATLMFDPDAEFNGMGSLHVSATDGTDVVTSVISVNVTPVVDEPVVVISEPLSLLEETSATVMGVSILDYAESPSGMFEIRIDAASGAVVHGVESSPCSQESESSLVCGVNLASVNTILGGLVYTPADDFFGVTSLLVFVSAPDGRSDSGEVAILVENVDEVPTLDIIDFTVDEDVSRPIGTALNLNDVDSLPEDVFTSSISVSFGTLSPPSLQGLIVNSLDNGTMEWRGSLGTMRAALSGASYAPVENEYGNVTIELTIDDGSTLDTGSRTVSGTLTIEVVPVNDEPVLTPGEATVSAVEDIDEVFNITIDDVEATAGEVVSLSACISATSGALSVNQVMITSSGEGSLLSPLCMQGSVDELNAELMVITFTPVFEFSGDVLVSVVVEDASVESGVISVTYPSLLTLVVADFNDPLNLTVPASHQASVTNENQIVFNGPSVVDVDGSDDNIISVAFMSAVSVMPLFAGFDVELDSSVAGLVTVSGLIDEVNGAIETVTFLDSVLSPTEVIAIRVTSTEDAGEVSDTYGVLVGDLIVGVTDLSGSEDREIPLPAAWATAGGVVYSLNADHEFSFSSEEGQFIAMDTLSTVPGSITPVLFDGALMSVACDSRATCDAMWEHIVYMPNADFHGQGGVTVTLVQSGSSSMVSRDVTVSAVNDPPTASGPSMITIVEDFARDLRSGFSVGDVDNGPTELVEVVLSVTAGELMYAGTNASEQTVIVPYSTIVGVLHDVEYIPVLNSISTEVLTLVARDPFNLVSPTISVPLVISSVNDPPTVDVLSVIDWIEDDDAVIGSFISLDDVDVGDILDVNITVSTGVLTDSSLASGSMLQFSGDVISILSEVLFVTYSPVLDFNGNVTLTVSVSDSLETVARTADVVVAPANDVPSIATSNLGAMEDIDRALDGAVTLSDDADGSGQYELTLTAERGSFIAPVDSSVVVIGSGSAEIVVSGTAVGDINAYLSRVVLSPPLNFNGDTSVDARLVDTAPDAAFVVNDAFVVSFAPIDDVITVAVADDVTAIASSGNLIIGENVIVVDDQDLTTTEFVNASLVSPSVTVPGATLVGVDITQSAEGVSIVGTDLAAVNEAIAAVQLLSGSEAAAIIDISAATIDTRTSLPTSRATATVTIGTPSFVASAEDRVVVEDDEGSLGSGWVAFGGDDATGTVSLSFTVGEGCLAYDLIAVPSASVVVNACGVNLTCTVETTCASHVSGIVYTPVTDSTLDVELVLSASRLLDSDVVLESEAASVIRIMPVNDAPILEIDSADLALSVDEDDDVTVSSLMISDVDATNLEVYSVTFEVNDATIGVASSLVSVDDSTPGVVFVFGSLPSVLNALSAVNISPVANFFGEIQVSVSVADGSGASSGVITIDVTVDSVDDQPEVVVRDDLVVEVCEHGSFSFASGDFALTDGDGPFSGVLIATVSNGELALLNGGSGPTVSRVGSDADMEFALVTMTYTPDGDFFGDAQLTISVSDGTAIGMRVVPITVTPVNDPPTVTVFDVDVFEVAESSGPASVPLFFSVADVEAGDDNAVDLTVSIVAQEGSLSVAQTAGVVISTDSRAVNVTGALTSVQVAIGSSLMYTSDVRYFGPDMLAVTVVDEDFAVAGDRVLNISVTPVDDVVSLVLTDSFLELDTDGNVLFPRQAVAIVDLDAAGETLTLTLTTSVSLNVQVSDGVSASTVGDVTTLEGSVEALNEALGAIVLTGVSEGTTNVAVSVTSPNSVTSTSSTDSGTVGVIFPDLLILGSDQEAIEEQPLLLAPDWLIVGGVNQGSTDRYALEVTASSGGISYDLADGDVTISFTQLSQSWFLLECPFPLCADALSRVTYTPVLDFFDVAQVTVEAGVFPLDADVASATAVTVIDISVEGVNDAPQLVVDVELPISVNEEQTYTFAFGSLGIVDVDNDDSFTVGMGLLVLYAGRIRSGSVDR